MKAIPCFRTIVLLLMTTSGCYPFIIRSITIMSSRHHYTEAEKAELLSNPYTFRVTDTSIRFTLAFKKFVLENIDKPGMTSVKVFEAAGYRKDIFTRDIRKSAIKRFRTEAASKEGLIEPKLPKKASSDSKKLHTESEYRKLEKRVTLLEQQLDFLKKSQMIREGKYHLPSDNSS